MEAFASLRETLPQVPLLLIILDSFLIFSFLHRSLLGQAMTPNAWMAYFATFVEAVRAAFPDKELCHNSQWFAGGSQSYNHPDVIREIKVTQLLIIFSFLFIVYSSPSCSLGLRSTTLIPNP